MTTILNTATNGPPQPLPPQPRTTLPPPIYIEDDDLHVGLIAGVIVFTVVIIIVIVVLMIMAFIRLRRPNRDEETVESIPIHRESRGPPIQTETVQRLAPEIPRSPSPQNSDYDYPKNTNSPVFHCDTLPMDARVVSRGHQNSSVVASAPGDSPYDYITSSPRQVEPLYDHPPTSPRPVEPLYDHLPTSPRPVHDHLQSSPRPVQPEQDEPEYINAKSYHPGVTHEATPTNPRLTAKSSKKLIKPSFKSRFSSIKRKDKSTGARLNDSFDEEPIYANNPSSHQEQN